MLHIDNYSTNYQNSQQRSSLPESKHLQEWQNSAVNLELTKLNLKSLSEEKPYEELLYGLSDSDRRNDGRIRDRYLKRYAHCERGGWWISGIDILTGEDAEWGQFKPDQPYKYQEKPKGFDPSSKAKNKILKYEAPPKVPTEIFALKVTLPIWEAIALRYDIPLPANIVVTPEGRALGFWSWVIEHPQIPLIITEGAKKAGALLTAGYAAIALPGIYNGFRQEKDDFGNKINLPYLIPQLEAFTQTDREIIFCFDNDIKSKTVKNVRTAIAKTGRLFTKAGCRVSVITWTYAEKGVDDLIFVMGVDCFHTLYNNRLPLSKFNLLALLSLSRYNPLKVNERYLSDNLVPPEDAQIIGLRSPKGTGKTEWLSRQTHKLIRTGKPALVLTHRIQLAKDLCTRFGIDHIEDIGSSETGGILGYGLCIDSLHPNSQAHFNPEDWSGAIVIIDEVEQIIWHMLHSSTCQDNRVAIIENLQQLLKTVIATGGKIYLSDADLSSIAIDYIQKLIDIPVKTWIVENVYNSSKKCKLINYSGNDPGKLIAGLFKGIGRGEKALVHTAGQKASSKYGTINLESDLKKKFPDRRILRIDSQSVAEPGHPAYGCMENLDSILSTYDIVICSPVIETGVSIDIKNHFDAVWCIAYGVQTVDAVCQTVERLREGVPRHIWMKKNAKNMRIGNGSTSIKALLRSQHQITKSNITLLQQAGINEFDDLEVDYSPESLNTWAKRACIVNIGKNNYREEITTKLLSEGYELDSPNEDDLEEADLIRESLTETRDKNYHAYCQEIPKVKAPTKSELEKLSNKKAKTTGERYQERKGNLIKRYGTEVTPELVEKDDKGWYPKLQLQYYMTLGNNYLAQRDRRTLSQIQKQGKGKAFKPDINKRQLSSKVKALKVIGMEQFLDSNTEFTKDSLDNWFKEKILPFRSNIKTILGISINPEKDSAIAVAQRILKQKLGLQLDLKHQVRRNGKRVRVYGGCNLNLDHRSIVFDNWLERDKSLVSEQGVTPFPNNIITTEGVTAG